MASPPVFVPGDSHGLRSLADYSPRVRRESDTTGQHTPAPGLVLGPHSPVSARALLSQLYEIPYPGTSLSHFQSYHPSLPLARILSSCFRVIPLSNFSLTDTHLAPLLSTPICPCCIQNEAQFYPKVSFPLLQQSLNKPLPLTLICVCLWFSVTLILDIRFHGPQPDSLIQWVCSGTGPRKLGPLKSLTDHSVMQSGVTAINLKTKVSKISQCYR